MNCRLLRKTNKGKWLQCQVHDLPSVFLMPLYQSEAPGLMERSLRRLKRRIMINSRPSPILLTVSVLLAICLFLALHSLGIEHSFIPWHRPSHHTASIVPASGMYGPPKQNIDTTSELGRASNATLGVRLHVLLRMSLD